MGGWEPIICPPVAATCGPFSWTGRLARSSIANNVNTSEKNASAGFGTKQDVSNMPVLVGLATGQDA